MGLKQKKKKKKMKALNKPTTKHNKIMIIQLEI